MIEPRDIAWENAPVGTTHLDCISYTWLKVEGDTVLSWNGCWTGRSSPAILGSHHAPRPVAGGEPSDAQKQIDWRIVPKGTTHFDPVTGLAHKQQEGKLYRWNHNLSLWYKPSKCNGLPVHAVARPAPSAATHFDPVKEAYYCASLAGLFVWSPEKERWVSTPDLSLSVNVIHLGTDREHPLTVEDWERGEARMDNIGSNGNEGEHYEEAFPCKGYEKLHNVFRDAHHHAAYQKGAERHANDLPFHEQRMQTISEGQDSPLGMAFQVQKKMLEGLQMKDPGACRRELLGALNYLAGIVIFLDKKNS